MISLRMQEIFSTEFEKMFLDFELAQVLQVSNPWVLVSVQFSIFQTKIVQIERWEIPQNWHVLNWTILYFTFSCKFGTGKYIFSCKFGLYIYMYICRQRIKNIIKNKWVIYVKYNHKFCWGRRCSDRLCNFLTTFGLSTSFRAFYNGQMMYRYIIDWFCFNEFWSCFKSSFFILFLNVIKESLTVSNVHTGYLINFMTSPAIIPSHYHLLKSILVAIIYLAAWNYLTTRTCQPWKDLTWVGKANG